MNSDSAKNGFKTFILTLSISLIVFSVIYYLVTNSSDEGNSAAYQASVSPSQVVGESKEVLGAEVQEQNAVPTEEPVSIFGELADKGINGSPTGTAAVLAGATSSPTTQTTSSVPDTGLVGITAGLLISLVFFLTGMYYISSNPRKVALSGFEKKVLKDN